MYELNFDFKFCVGIQNMMFYAKILYNEFFMVISRLGTFSTILDI